jgi:hypothetical protein
MASHPLTGITREIAEAISATVRRVATEQRRDATVGEMAEAVARIPAIAALTPNEGR